MLASGVAAQNQFFGSMSNLLLEHGKANPGDKAAAKDAIQHVQAFRRPVYADEVENLTRSFQQVLLEMKPQSAERVKQTAATMKDSLKGLTDTLPRDSGGLSISPDGILGMIATGLEQVEVPEAYRPEMASATDTLKQAISAYFATMMSIQMKELTRNERTPLSDDPERKP